jgi:hypothetical protein
MATSIRKTPPVCLGISILRMVRGKLRYPKQCLGQKVKIEDGQEFTIFRHASIYPDQVGGTTVVFIVSFRFSHLSHKANRIASLIPMLLITGFPGFGIKMYGVNRSNGYWMGMYQWVSIQALEEYKKSFVFRIMNRRAAENSVTSIQYSNQRLIDCFDELKI